MNWSTRVHLLIVAAATVPVVGLVLLGVAGPWALSVALPAAGLGWIAARAVAAPMREAETVAKRLGQGQWQARPVGRLPEPWDAVVGAMTDLADDLASVSKDLERQVGERTAQLERKAGQLRALGQVGHQVAAVREPGPLLHYVVRLVRGTFGYDMVAIVQDGGNHFIAAACAMRGEAEPPVGRVFAADDPAVRSLTAALEQRPAGSTASPGNGLRDPDGAGRERREPIPLIDGWRPEAELIVPIRHGTRTLGAMIVQSASPRAFDEDDIFTVDTIAGQVAVALENARLFESERQLRRLAITEERNRIAREIHDTLAQGFMGILIHLRAMQGADDPVTADAHRRAAESLAQESLQEARRSVWNLRPARLHDRGLAGALEDELERLRSQSDLRTRLQIAGDAEAARALPTEAAAALLRVGQEALHNVVKHARAKSVTVALDVETDKVAALTVTDDGIGFIYPRPAASARSNFGLIGMQERVEALGGTLSIETAPGGGTTIRVDLPLGTKEVGP